MELNWTILSLSGSVIECENWYRTSDLAVGWLFASGV